jgi:hypothetical protein
LEQVLHATGVCGSNIAYVTDLADFLRSNEFKDDHLFELESIILEKLKVDGDGDDESSSSSSSSTLTSSSDLDMDSI